METAWVIFICAWRAAHPARLSNHLCRIAHGVPLRDGAVVGVAESVPRQDERLPGELRPRCPEDDDDD